jgi:hypothetical protein
LSETIKDTPQERYRKKNPKLYRKAALKYYHNNKEKCSERAKKYREENKEHIRDKQREAKRKRKLEAIQYLGGKCISCKEEFHPAVYEFHHRDPKTKDRDPSKMLSLSWERVVKELDNCDLLCANCHRLEHHRESYQC